MEPGTAKTSRPKSVARRAVISEPERRDASTTTTPEERPAMIRLRIGKFCGRGSVPGGYSESEQVLGGQALLQPARARADSRRRGRTRARRSSRPGPRARPRAPRHRRRARSPRRPPSPAAESSWREAPGHVAPVPRRVPRAHDRHGRQPEPLEPAERVEEERRIGDLPEGLGILGVEGRHEPDAGALDRRRPAQRLAYRPGRAERRAPAAGSPGPRTARPRPRTAGPPPRRARAGPARAAAA